MNIELRGTEEEHRKLCSILNEAHHPVLYKIVQEIEDQLEPNADRAFDFIALEDIL